MINGTFSVPRVPEESTCRTSKDYQFTDTGIYKIHSTSLMPNVQFDEAVEENNSVDETIFVNDEDTQLTFQPQIKQQNYMTCQFIGRAPLEWYNEGEFTKMGREFMLICNGGKTGSDFMVFGTEAAIRGYNRDAASNVSMPGGGE